MLPTSGATVWSRFGSSMAASGDLLVVAGPSAVVDNDMNEGAAYVFSRDVTSDQWSQQKQLLPSDGSLVEEFAQDVAIDGDTIAVTIASKRAWNGLVQEAAVYLFERHEGGTDQWGQIAKLTDPVVAQGGDFASSIALAGDLLFVGAVSPLADGMVMVFERNRGGPNAWSQIATILENDLGALKGTDEAFGRSLAVDGDTLLIGAPPDRATSEEGDFFWTNNDGAVYVFNRDPINRDQWLYATRLASSAAAGEWDNFGSELALAGDTAIVGAPEPIGTNGGSPGGVYVFRRDASLSDTWNQMAKLSASDGLGVDHFGSALALAGDTLLVGASRKTLSQGGAYFFRRSSAASDAWEQLAAFGASDGQSSEQFGTAVALAGDTSFVGSPQRTGPDALPATHYYGAVYMYDLQAEVVAPVECEPSFAPTDTLVDGAVISSPLGVVVGTAPGTLLEPLPIWILEGQTPAEPLYAGAVALGAYYNIGAHCTTRAPLSSPFVVALPVPAGADIDHLAVGVLTSGASIHDIDTSARIWSRLTGVYDAARQLYVVTTTALDLEGHTFVLVEDAALEPATPGSASRLGADAPQFVVQCMGMPVGQCFGVDKLRVEQVLVEAYEDYAAQHFLDPALQYAVPNLGQLADDSGLMITFQHPNVYAGINIEPADAAYCIGNRGYYNPETMNLSLCGNPGLIPDADLKFVLRHELFHAVQHAYPNVQLGTALTNKWVIEGTATAAAAWNGSMVRAHEDYSLRRADVSLNTSIHSYAYEAQDFWVHLFTSTTPIDGGSRRALPLGELASFLERGATTESVADRLRSPPNSTYGTLEQEYWAWVKNQVIEKTDVTFSSAGTTRDDVLTNACKLQRRNPNLIVGEGQALPGFTFDPENDEFSETITAPLASRVVQIRFPNAQNGITVQVTGDPGLAYKIYLRDDEEDCIPVQDNEPRTFPELDAHSIVYVLVANTSYSSASVPLNYTIKVVCGADGVCG
jgi:hypothetical protein